MNKPQLQYIPYQVASVPPPGRVSSAPLPWNNHEIRSELMRAAARDKSSSANANFEKKRKEGIGGFFSGLANVVVAEVQGATTALGWTQADLESHMRIMRERFLRFFKLLAYEPFWYGFTAKSVAPIGGQSAQGIPGEIYVTSRSICFTDEMHERTDMFFKFALPLRDVCSIRLAVTRSTPPANSTDPPLLDVMEDLMQEPRGVMIYTRDMRVHLFYGFLSSTLCRQFYNVADQAWRAFASLPPPQHHAPGSEYPDAVWMIHAPPAANQPPPPPSYTKEAPPTYSQDAPPPSYTAAEAPPAYAQEPSAAAPPSTTTTTASSDATLTNPFSNGSNPYAFNDQVSAPPSAGQVFDPSPPPSYNSADTKDSIYPPLQSSSAPQFQNPYSFENTPKDGKAGFFDPYEQ